MQKSNWDKRQTIVRYKKNTSGRQKSYDSVVKENNKLKKYIKNIKQRYQQYQKQQQQKYLNREREYLR